jgi:hypothetical protein
MEENNFCAMRKKSSTAPQLIDSLGDRPNPNDARSVSNQARTACSQADFRRPQITEVSFF